MLSCKPKKNCKSGLPTQRLNGSTPADEYQRQKIIQGTVRVPSSVYTMNLGALNVYQAPDARYGVNWNQMSDRKERHVQPSGAAGTNPGANSTKRSVTRLRPGALSPGGAGVDIKHNSYERYLNRLKGKGPVKQENPPANFGRPIVFNPADPVYGGKVFKTGIVAGCVCNPTNNNAYLLYNNRLKDELNILLFKPALYTEVKNCVCPDTTEPPKNQYYGYSSSNSFLLQCTKEVVCGEVIPVL